MLLVLWWKCNWNEVLEDPLLRVSQSIDCTSSRSDMLDLVSKSQLSTNFKGIITDHLKNPLYQWGALTDLHTVQIYAKHSRSGSIPCLRCCVHSLRNLRVCPTFAFLCPVVAPIFYQPTGRKSQWPTFFCESDTSSQYKKTQPELHSNTYFLFQRHSAPHSFLHTSQWNILTQQPAFEIQSDHSTCV